MINYSGKLQQLLCLITCVLMVVAVSIRRDGKVAGRELKQQQKASPKTETMVVLEDGSVRLNTTELGKDIIGYGGTVPLEITLQDGRVKNIKALANSESPEFFGEASALLSKWDGQTIEDAQKMKVDGVTGATFSSKAIIGNVQRGLQYAAKNPVKESASAAFDFSPKAIAGLIVVLLAAILPLFVKDRRYRIGQWYERDGIDCSGHHAYHRLRISSFWQEIILLHACVSVWFFARTCRKMCRIQNPHETDDSQALGYGSPDTVGPPHAMSVDWRMVRVD